MNEFQIGDVIVTYDPEGESVSFLYQQFADQIEDFKPLSKPGEPCYNVDYIIAYDEDTGIFSARSFGGFREKPSMVNFNKDDHIILEHTFIDIDNFEDYEIVGNVPPTLRDMMGYYDYIKYNDLGKYLELTGENYEDMQKNSARFHKLGENAFQNGDIESAYLHFKEALDHCPTPNAYHNLGQICMELHQYEQSLYFFEMAIKTLTSDSYILDQYYINLGYAHYHLGDDVAAKESFKLALKYKKSMSDEQYEEIQRFLNN